MTLTDEYLVRYLDKELDADEHAMVDDAIDRSSDIAQRLEAMRRADMTFAADLDSINARPLPAAVMAALGLDGARAAPAAEERAVPDQGQVIPFAPRPKPRPVAWQLPLAAGIALVIGVGLGMQIGGDAMDSTGWTQQSAGLVDPGHPLYAALERGPSGRAIMLDETAVQPTMTFIAKDGRPCREFEVTAGAHAGRGLACRGENAVWSTVVMTFGEARLSGNPGAPYSPAFGGAGSAVATATGELIAGDPLGNAEEQALIEKGWR